MSGNGPKPNEVDLLVERMHSVRSAGCVHVSELQGEAKRLVDWKEYVLTKPLVSVAAASLVGFFIVRSAMRPPAIPLRQGLESQQLPTTSSSLKSTVVNGILSFATSLASSAIKNYVANLAQSSISEGGSSDRFSQFKTNGNVS